MNYPTAGQVQGRALARLHASYVQETTGCWRWTRSKTTTGYGHFHWHGEYYQAHRFLYGVLREPVTTTAMDHLCRNRWCVNPWHLEPVTHRENVRRGSSTKLDPSRVKAIHDAAQRGLSTRAIGRLFAIDHSTVSRVLNGHLWAECAPKEAAA